MLRLRSEPLICALLCAGVVVVYLQTLGFDFVNVDDLTYVRANPKVTGGLTLDGFLWAFGNAHSSNWVPLTWISYMLDCSVFGVDPGALHGVNAALHAAASCLLFSALLRLSNAEPPSAKGAPRPIDPFWPSAAVAALFAFHPAHVESVAWIAERKDVLSALFWMLALLAYAAYVRNPPRARASYALLLAAFALGLLSKSMLMTLPFVLLLLDVWPLRRIDLDSPDLATARRLVVEKLPLLALSIVAGAVVFAVQRRTGAMQTLELIPLPERLCGLSIGYVRYVWMLLFPADLGFLYPRLTGAQLSFLPVAGALIVLASLTAGAIALRSVAPYLLVGWLWFVGTLVPVIGLVQVGEQSLADRYTYLPSIGLFIGLAWGAAALWPRGRLARTALAGASVAGLIACILAARAQASTWKDSISLWSRAVQVTRENATAHDQLGLAYFEDGRVEEALPHNQRAVELRPDSVRTQTNFGNALLAAGRVAAAREAFAHALDIDPDSAGALNGMASCLHRLGDFAGALDRYESLFAAVPGLIENDSARRLYAMALRDYQRKPGDHFDAAVERYRRATVLKPDWLAAQTNLVWALATDPRANRDHAESALAITERESSPFALAANPSVRRLDARAAALAAAGRFQEAILSTERALALARKNADAEKIRELEERMALYRAGRRYVEQP